MIRVPHRFPLRMLLLAALLVVPACGRDGEGDRGSAEPGTADSGVRPVVAVPLLPLAGLVDRLLPAEAADVVVLVPAGSSPHAFEPGVAQLRQLSDARVVLLIGHPAFTWERTWLADAVGRESDRAVPLAGTCPSIADDPHVWLDPDCLKLMARAAAAALAAAMPEHGPEIGARLDRLVAATDSAAAEASRALGPGAGRTFLVVHPAWGYFARAFGLEQVSILSHGSGDSGAARLAAVIERARREGIRTVVVQPQYSAEVARIVAEEIGGDVAVLDPLRRDPVSLLVETARVLGRAAAP